MRAALRFLLTSDGLAILAGLSLLLGVDRLAGLWWAVLAAAPLLGWMAWVAHLEEQQQAEPKDGP